MTDDLPFKVVRSNGTDEIIAGEWQRDGRIPEGKIISVSRMRLVGG
jgi:hypothetical protein